MVKRPTVLVLTQQLDAHADLVIRELHHRNAQVIRFNTADFPHKATLVARHTTGRTWEGELVVDQHALSLQEITGMWYRRPTPSEIDPALPPAAQQFAQAEARMAIGGVLRSLSCRWVNRPEKMVAADYKPYQLEMARACGLETPDTLLTNSAHAARQFLAEHPYGIIYKTLSGALVFSESGEPLSIYTSRVSLQDLEQEDSIRQTACLFQEEVSKELELRITVVGEQVFAAEIFSQHSSRTQVDFRQAEVMQHKNERCGGKTMMIRSDPRDPFAGPAAQARMHMVDRLKQEGAITSSAVEAAFRTIPRHLFLETFYLREQTAPVRWKQVKPSALDTLGWCQLVYADAPRITRLNEIGNPISSSSAPTIRSEE